MKIVKRFIIFVFVIIVLFSLCGCETKEERALKASQREVERLEVEYEKAKRESEKVKRDVDAYYDALDELNKYK